MPSKWYLHSSLQPHSCPPSHLCPPPIPYPCHPPPLHLPTPPQPNVRGRTPHLPTPSQPHVRGPPLRAPSIDLLATAPRPPLPPLFPLDFSSSARSSAVRGSDRVDGGFRVLRRVDGRLDQNPRRRRQKPHPDDERSQPLRRQSRSL